MKTILFNDLIFEINYSKKRKNMDILMDRDGKLFVKVPKHTKIKSMKEFIKEKEFWLYRKLDDKDILFKQKLILGTKKKTAIFLGKKYPIIFETRQQNNNHNTISLKHGKFILNSAAKKNTDEHLIDWYRSHARKIILNRLEKLQDLTGLKPKNIRVMDLGNRWGSCSSNNVLNFHWKVILAPPKILEYIILHEMIHMIEKKHIPEFWKKISKFMPDYMTRKTWLSENGFSFSALKK